MSKYKIGDVFQLKVNYAEKVIFEECYEYDYELEDSVCVWEERRQRMENDILKNILFISEINWRGAISLININKERIFELKSAWWTDDEIDECFDYCGNVTDLIGGCYQ